MATYKIEIEIEGVDSLTPVLQSIQNAVADTAQNVNANLNSITSNMQAMGAAAQQAAQQASGGLNVIGQNLQKTARDVRPVGMALAGIGAAALGGIGLSVNATREFELAMNAVAAVAKLTEEEYEALEEGALHYGTTTVFTATQVANAMEQLAKAGFSVQEVLEAIYPTLNLAVAGDMNMEAASTVVVRAMRGMGLETTETQRAVDTLAKAAAATTADVSDLGLAFSYAAPMAYQANWSFEQLAAAIGVVSDAGIVGMKAGTGLQAMIREMSAPSRQQADLMRKLGVSFFDAQGRMRPLTNIVAQFEKAFERLSDNERLAALQILFLDQGARVMAALATQGSDRLKELEVTLEESGGEAERMGQTRLRGLAGALIELRVSVNAAAITFGQVFAPVVTVLAKALGGLARGFAGLPAPVRAVLGGLLATAGVALTLAGAFLLILGPLGVLLQGVAALPVAIPAAIGSIKAIISAMRLWMATTLSLTVALRALLIGTGIGAVLVAGAWLFSKFTEPKTPKPEDYMPSGSRGVGNTTVNVYDPVVRDDSDIQRLAESVSMSTRRAVVGVR